MILPVKIHENTYFTNLVLCAAVQTFIINWYNLTLVLLRNELFNRVSHGFAFGHQLFI
jgi:hypothetical protein